MNKKHLKGLRCPKDTCQSEGPFVLSAQMTIVLHDDGLDVAVPPTDVTYAAHNTCQCQNCGFEGTVEMFSAMTPTERQKLINAYIDDSFTNPRLLRQLVEVFCQKKTYQDYVDFFKYRRK